LNFGRTTIIKNVNVNNNIRTPPPTTALHCQLLFNIFDTAHIAVIGDFIISCKPMATSISTWVTSLVVLVIKLLVENFFTSPSLKFSTFSNMSFLIVFENDAAIYETIKPTITADIRLPKAHNNILDP